MPPVGYRKRERSSSPGTQQPPSKRKAVAKAATKADAKRTKRTIFDTVDEPTKTRRSLEENKKFLEEQGGDDESSSLSDAESDDFEDVHSAKRRKTGLTRNENDDEDAEQDEDEEDDDDEMTWEDAAPAGPYTTNSTPAQEIADISISMNDDGNYVEPLVSAATGRKGPSKAERKTRVLGHCLHVQSLMWHNHVRNQWLNDKEVQKTLVGGIGEGVWREVQRWREAMGMLSKEELEAKEKEMARKAKRKGRKRGNSAGRDWSYGSGRQDEGVPNLSGGDPLLRLLKVLTAYWRKRFTVVAPGIRKQGHMSLGRMRDEINGWKKNRKDFEQYGERVEGLEDFRKRAKTCEGSRDVGEQLFVALLRGLGLEARMVANLQPMGFGWSKSEEADAKKPKSVAGATKLSPDSLSEEDVEEPKSKGARSNTTANGDAKDKKGKRKSARGNKAAPINIDDSESPLSDPPSEAEAEAEAISNGQDSDDLSVVDITPALAKKKPGKKYDRDLAFPNYWTEVCSPVSNKYIPVDPIVLSTIASTDELVQTFEPRGAKADKSKQVICYTIAFNADSTAKDVTVRYLKRHQLPGKTKGLRVALEKVPIYNRKGKVKRYDEFDWFGTLMSAFHRPHGKRTPGDDLEEQTDLKPFKPAKEEKEVEKESLQGYKQSADFVLEQHLRREEALHPGAQPVKDFVVGKGDKAKTHPVYRRDDVLVCRSSESWHKEGRELKQRELPIKYVPMRAVTLTRKREVEDAQRESGEKLKQGLYSRNQTDWIIPPPIEDGRIPKNAFGNMDVYVPTMVPRGAVHLPLRGSAKLCRKLAIDYAEACTGFEFGKQRAVPVLTGVVVADYYEGLVRDAWRAEQIEVKRKEDTKRTEAALKWWRKMLLGLRVLERMKKDYESTGGKDEVNPFVAKANREGREESKAQEEGGGFLPENDEGDEPVSHVANKQEDGDGGDFQREDDVANEGGGFLIEDETEDVAKAPSKNHRSVVPMSLQSLHQTADGNADSDGEQATTDASPAKKTPTAATRGVRKQRQPRSSTANTKAKGKQRSKPVTLSEDEDEDSESPLSALSDPIDNDNGPDEPRDEAPAVTRPQSKKKTPASPRVVPGRPAANVRTRSAKKATPVKSQYFSHEKQEDGEGVEEGESESSEVEVVEPRATTARTRTSTRKNA